MEAKGIEIATLHYYVCLIKNHTLPSSLMVSCMTVHRVAHCLSEGETLKDRPHEGIRQVVKTGTIRKAFERNPKLKMMHLTKKKGILVSTLRRAVKIEWGKSLKLLKKSSY